MTARALDAFGAVIFRGLAVLRGLVVAFTAAYVGIWWHDFYGPAPARLLGPALIVAWSAVYCAVAGRPALRRALIGGDVAVGVAATVIARWTLPSLSLGDPSSWVLLTVLLAGMSAVCGLRTGWSFVALAVLAVAFVVPAYDRVPQTYTSLGLLLFVCLALRQAVVRLLRVAVDADAWLDAVAARTRAEAVATARARANRAHERFLHDTVLNELTGIGLGGVVGATESGPEAADSPAGSVPRMSLPRARERCRRIVADAERLLAAAGGDEEPLANADAELARLLDEVAAEAGETGLRVAVRHRARAGQSRWPRATARGSDPAGPEVLPVEVVTALAAATREALTNVRRHAGVLEALVSVDRWLDGVRVRVADSGVGFDTTRFELRRAEPHGDPDAAHLGIRESLHGRMADVGGWARVTSQPGAGTVVDLEWQIAQPEVPRLSGQNLWAAYEQATRRAVGVVLVASVAVFALLAFGFRHHATPSLRLLVPAAPYLSILLWIFVAAGIARIVVVMRRRPLTGTEAAATLGFAVLAVLAGAAISEGDDVVRIYDWAGTMAPAILLMPITVSRPARQWGAAVVVVGAAVLAVGVPRIEAHPLDLGRLVYVLYGMSTLQLLVTTAGPLLRASADTTTRAAALDAELGAHQAAAAAVRRDQARRLARLDRDVLPLLRAVADGAADPRRAEVRALCAGRARALRRMLAGSGGRAGPLAELETAIEAAEARGGLVVLQVSGELGTVPAPVRDEIVDLVSEVLRAAAPGRVLCTLWCDSGEGFLAYPGPAVALGHGAAEPGALTARIEADDANTVVALRWEISGAREPALALA